MLSEELFYDEPNYSNDIQTCVSVYNMPWRIELLFYLYIVHDTRPRGLFLTKLLNILLFKLHTLIMR